LRVISEELTTSISELELCLVNMHNEIIDAFSKVGTSAAISERSDSMKKLLQESTAALKLFKWIPKTRDGQAPFQVDAVYRCSGECKSMHVINIVICLFNREAIGTNFLKLEISALAEIRTYQKVEMADSNILGILLTFDKDLLALGRWDNSYAASSEYTVGLRKFYKPFMRSNITSLRVHA